MQCLPVYQVLLPRQRSLTNVLKDHIYLCCLLAAHYHQRRMIVVFYKQLALITITTKMALVQRSVFSVK